MRNISDKNCRENQNTRFAFSFFSPHVVTFTTHSVTKIWLCQTDHRWKYNTAHALTM